MGLRTIALFTGAGASTLAAVRCMHWLHARQQDQRAWLDGADHYESDEMLAAFGTTQEWV